MTRSRLTGALAELNLVTRSAHCRTAESASHRPLLRSSLQRSPEKILDLLHFGKRHNKFDKAQKEILGKYGTVLHSPIPARQLPDGSWEPQNVVDKNGKHYFVVKVPREPGAKIRKTVHYH